MYYSSICLFNQFFLQFLQRFSFGFRNTAPYKQESAETDNGVKQEGTASAQSGIQERECVGKQEGSNPQRSRTYCHGYPTPLLGNISESNTQVTGPNDMA